MVEKGRNKSEKELSLEEEDEDGKSDKAVSLHFVPLKKLSDF